MPDAIPPLLIKRLDPRATLPRYQTLHAAGMDLAACVPPETTELVIEPGKIVLVRTGFAMAVPVGYEAQVRPRSGLASKFGVTLPNAPGTIDADYRGEVLVPLINLGSGAFTITHGMRIAQMVIAPVAQVDVVETDQLNDTERGSGGFGSTGLAQTQG
jgi:dUTP pyrophosphatase